MSDMWEGATWNENTAIKPCHWTEVKINEELKKKE